MCGICGVFDIQKQDRINLADLNHMAQVLKHRGPDDMAVYRNRNIGFGFQRLSIVDLDGGAQPLINEDGTIILICNGEIFNYQQLRNDMIHCGHQFKSHTDVEVILHMYEEYGTELVHKLNGQFAFAIYDTRRERLFCARDKVGIAPFYYTVVDHMFIFGSEIKSILQHPMVQKSVDLVGLDQLMTFPGPIAPRTYFKNIWSLKSGHFLLVEEDWNHKQIEYWDLNYPVGEIESKGNEEYYTHRLDEILTKAVNDRLQADVPVGFYLSGGLDSSIIASKINQINPQVKRDSFSIDFGDKLMSESKYQHLMAMSLNSNHHEQLFKFDDIEQRLGKAIYHSEGPLKETYNIASLMLSEEVHQNDTKVVLTGEGADELFAGYVGYRFDQFRAQTKPFVREEEKALRQRLWGDENFFYEKDYSQFAYEKKQIYSKEITSIYDEIDCSKYPLIDIEKIRDRDLINKRSYIDFKLRLSEHLLGDHGDRMALANSVEARFPFLDEEVIEFARTMPVNLKLNSYNEKYVLKKMASKYVPKEIINRPKFTFVAPGSSEFLKKKKEFVFDYLSYETIKRQGFFNPDTVERLKKQYVQPDFKLNLPFDNDHLIIILTFGIFLKEFQLDV